MLDTLYNGKDLAIVDSSIEAHMLDLLIYRQNAKISPECGPAQLHGLRQVLPGRRHLRRVPLSTDRLKVGDRISIQDAAGYTMVKKNWFNGVKMPSIAVTRARRHVSMSCASSPSRTYVASLS